MTLTDLYYYASSESEPPPEPQRVTLASARLKLSGGAIDVRLDGEDRPTGLTSKVYRHTNYRRPVATLTGDRRREGQIRLSDPGHGRHTIANSHDDRGLVVPGDLIRVELDGRAIHQWVVTEQDSATARETAADQVTVNAGPGVLALWAEAPVFPSLGVGRRPIERDRIWSWVSPTPIFDDTGWRHAKQITTVATARTTWPYLPFGENFPFEANHAHVLGPSVGTVDLAPAGVCYVRQDITVDVAGTYGFWCLIDNAGEAWVDGIPIAEVDPEDGFINATYVAVDLSVGTHTVAARIENAPDDDPPGGNPIGFAFCGFRVDPSGAPASSVPAFLSNAAVAKIVEYPTSPPGMTVGAVLTGLLAEWQNLGFMIGWDVTFDEHVDSNGTPWPLGEYATKVGTDGRTFLLDELAQTYIDVRAHNGALVLDACVRDTLGADRALELVGPTDRDPDTANITSLDHHRSIPKGTAALVLWEGGWTFVDATVDGERKRGVLLGLGAQPSESAAHVVARGELNWMRTVQESITAGFRPRTLAERPDRSAEVGDRITVPAWDGTPSLERLLSWTYDEDEHGTITWAPELKNVRLQAEERHEQALKKMSDGTVRGTSRVATPVAAIATANLGPNCCAPSIGGAIVTRAEDGVPWGWVLTSAGWTAPVACTLTKLSLTGTYSFGWAFAAQVLVNDVEVLEVSAPALGTGEVTIEATGSVALNAGDVVRFTAAGDGNDHQGGIAGPVTIRATTDPLHAAILANSLT